jgi:hypothetical protein
VVRGRDRVRGVGGGVRVSDKKPVSKCDTCANRAEVECLHPPSVPIWYCSGYVAEGKT